MVGSGCGRVGIVLDGTAVVTAADFVAGARDRRTGGGDAGFRKPVQRGFGAQRPYDIAADHRYGPMPSLGGTARCFDP